jgi:hypothetical protein
MRHAVVLALAIVLALGGCGQKPAPDPSDPSVDAAGPPHPGTPDARPGEDPEDPDPDARPVDEDNLDWKPARLTEFTSYPEPGSEECEEFSGCKYAGYFEFVDGQQTEEWVEAHNIAAVHSDDAGDYALKTLRVRHGDARIDVTVYDMCSDSDCDGCCTQNRGSAGFLVDLESYTYARFGVDDDYVEFACLDC